MCWGRGVGGSLIDTDISIYFKVISWMMHPIVDDMDYKNLYFRKSLTTIYILFNEGLLRPNSRTVLSLLDM